MAADLEEAKKQIGLIAAMEQLTTLGQRWTYQLKLAYEQTLKNEKALQKATTAAKNTAAAVNRIAAAAKQAAQYSAGLSKGFSSAGDGGLLLSNSALQSEYFFEYAKKLELSTAIVDSDLRSMDSVFKGINTQTVGLEEALAFLQQKFRNAADRLNQEDFTRNGEFMRRYNDAKALWEQLKIDAPGSAQASRAFEAFSQLEKQLKDNQSGIVQTLKNTIDNYGKMQDYLRSIRETYDDPELYSGGQLASLLKQAIDKLGGTAGMTDDEIENLRIANFNFQQAQQSGKTYKLDLTVGNQTLTTIADRDPQEFIDALMAALENARRSAA